jgi:hypothetical protein
MTISVMTPKDFEDACRNLVGTSNAVISVAWLSIHALAMYAFFAKFIQAFNPNHIETILRQKIRANRVAAEKAE